MAALAATCLGLAGCSEAAGELGEASAEAARVEPVEGIDQGTVTLTKEAFLRLGVRTEPLRAVPGSAAVMTVIPEAALLYDANGLTWVFTSPKDRVFLRATVTVDHFDDDLVYLKAGPAPGTAVATVGVPELYGAELGVEGE